MTDFTLDLPTRTDGFSQLNNSSSMIGISGTVFGRMRWDVGGSTSRVSQGHALLSNWTYRGCLFATELDGDTAKMQANVASGTMDFVNIVMESFEVS